MYLFVDVSQAGKIVLKLIDNKEILLTKIHEGDFKLTEKLLFFIDQLLSDKDIKLKNLNGIITVKGPGAFTSLRIMSVIINTISQQKSIPVYSDIYENLNTDSLIINNTSKVKANQLITPYYDKEPNITIY